MHCDVTERDVQDFQETWRLPLLRVGGEVSEGLGDVAPVLNCLAEQLWHQDCIAAGSTCRQTREKTVTLIWTPDTGAGGRKRPWVFTCERRPWWWWSSGDCSALNRSFGLSDTSIFQYVTIYYIYIYIRCYIYNTGQYGLFCVCNEGHSGTIGNVRIWQISYWNCLEHLCAGNFFFLIQG